MIGKIKYETKDIQLGRLKRKILTFIKEHDNENRKTKELIKTLPKNESSKIYKHKK